MKSLILPPLSALYGAVTRTRLALYRRGTFRTTKLDRPVISVGNITAGGTGKTPLVEWVARSLAGRGLKVCILTRGYGRENPEQQVVVSDGSKILATPGQAGDEPYLLATKLLNANLPGSVAVISNADRISAGRYAIETFATDCFVLDDGFQHLRLARDLDIVVIDATNPFGTGQLLREPVSSLVRADCVVLTRCDQASSVDLSFIRGRPVFKSSMKAVNAPRVTGPVAAFCAVGNPQSFFEQLRKHGYELVHEKAFTDHHSYTQKDVDDLIERAKRSGPTSLLTTAKDAVKLQSLSFSMPWNVFEIEIQIKDESALAELIKAALV